MTLTERFMGKFIPFIQLCIRTRMRFHRGKNWIQEVAYLFVTMASIKIMFPEFAESWYYIIMVIAGILFIIVGYIEEKKIMTWAYELGYSAGKINPFWIKMDKKINKLLVINKKMMNKLVLFCI